MEVSNEYEHRQFWGKPCNPIKFVDKSVQERFDKTNPETKKALYKIMAQKGIGINYPHPDSRPMEIIDHDDGFLYASDGTRHFDNIALWSHEDMLDRKESERVKADRREALIDKVIDVMLYIGYWVYWVAWCASVAFFGASTWQGIGIGFLCFVVWVSIIQILTWINSGGWLWD